MGIEIPLNGPVTLEEEQQEIERQIGDSYKALTEAMLKVGECRDKLAETRLSGISDFDLETIPGVTIEHILPTNTHLFGLAVKTDKRVRLRQESSWITTRTEFWIIRDPMNHHKLTGQRLTVEGTYADGTTAAFINSDHAFELTDELTAVFTRAASPQLHFLLST